MKKSATCAFTIDSWKAEPYDERDGIALSRTRVTKTFTGDLAGSSTAELLMAMAPHESAAYVGFERIECTLNGRSGSFILHHSATGKRGKQTASWTIVPDTGTGDLEGIRGEAQILIAPDGSHTLVLDYEIV
ncbi:MAG TPA: DUF3224 domain-containing protein [Ktedonobacterales bacterium]